MEEEKKGRIIGTSLKYEELNFEYEAILKGEQDDIDDFVEAL